MTASAPRFVAYYRVSTSRQGMSGLGLEAQQNTCENFVASRGGRIIEAFTEVESGKRDARPKLEKALNLAKVTGSTLLIAKLDRLSRNAVFLLTLRDSGVSFVAADMPEANSLTIGILAIVAQHEREAISSRTKAALAAAKAKGTKLGRPNNPDFIAAVERGRKRSAEVVQEKVKTRTALYRPIIEAIRDEGITSLGGIANELNKRGIQTANGRTWHPTSVRNVILRAEVVP